MELVAQVAPITAAAEQLGRKSPVASALRTREWADMPAQLRTRAMFSAGVEDARFLSTLQAKLLDAIRLKREQVKNGEAFVDRGSFIADLRKVAQEQGITLTGWGDITDVGSRARLGLIYDMQIQQAQGYATWKQDQSPDVLAMVPAQELVRIERRKQPRDWEARWTAAGGKLVNGRMVALKTDPVWQAISRFGTPFPPFDFGSGMGLRDVMRSEAVELGLIGPDDVPEPVQAGFNDGMEARIADPAMREWMSRQFGDQVSVKGSQVAWNGDLIGNLFDEVSAAMTRGEKMSSKAWKGRTITLGVASPRAVQAASGVVDLRNARLQVRPENVYHVVKAHGAGMEKRRDQRPVTRRDFASIPLLWMNPDYVEPHGGTPGSYEFRKRIDGTLYGGILDKYKNDVFNLATLYVKEDQGGAGR